MGGGLLATPLASYIERKIIKRYLILQLLILLFMLQVGFELAQSDTLNLHKDNGTNATGSQYGGSGDFDLYPGQVSGETPNTQLIPSRPTILNDSALLILAIVLLSISFFLLYQSISFLKWASRKDSNAPPAKAGLYFAWIGVVLVSFLWLIALMSQYRYMIQVHHNISWIGPLFLDEPHLLVAPVILASIIPSVIALYKFSIANSYIRASTQIDQGYLRPPMIALVGAAFTILQLAAAIATLIMYWSTK